MISHSDWSSRETSGRKLDLIASKYYADHKCDWLRWRLINYARAVAVIRNVKRLQVILAQDSNGYANNHDNCGPQDSHAVGEARIDKLMVEIVQKSGITLL